MQRVPEPELMDGEAQARAYAEADFDEPNRLFLELFAERFPEVCGAKSVVDLGCGPGDIALRFARRHPEFRVTGLDGSPAMIGLALERLAREPALAARVQFSVGVLPAATSTLPEYDVVISNSLLHHLHRPEVLWSTIGRCAAPGAPVLVMDLRRPPSETAARSIVEAYASGEPDVLRHDFYHSLLAAFEPGEVREQLEDAGVTTFVVEEVSDRHLAVWGRARCSDNGDDRAGRDDSKHGPRSSRVSAPD